MLSDKNISLAKYEKYLQGCDEKKKRYVKKIVENLLYIKTGELVEMVRHSLREFKKNVEKYNLYIPPGKIGSEHYLMMQLREELNPVNVVIGMNPVTNDYPMLILDDAIYSSHHMCGTIDLYRYETGCQNKFYVVVGILSTPEVTLLTDTAYLNADVIAHTVCKDLLPENLFEDYDQQYMYTEFGCETEYILPLYFEHKLADKFSAYQFIADILDKPTCRKVIDDITPEDLNKFISSFQQ